MRKINWLVIVAMFVVGAFLFESLPNMIPTHWNALGEVDSYMPKKFGVWMMPVMALVMNVMFAVVPRLDPKKEKYHLFAHEWKIIQTGIVGFFAYIYFVTLYIALKPETAMLPLMFVGLGTLFMLIGNYLSKIRQNFFIGIKIPWTLSSEENWNKTHKFASYCFVVAGLVTLIEAKFLWYAPGFVLGGILLAAFLPMVYSFLLFKKMLNRMKYVYLAIIMAILIIFGIRMSTPEDSWICSNGKWEMHGTPSSQMPTEECK